MSSLESFLNPEPPEQPAETPAFTAAEMERLAQADRDHKANPPAREPDTSAAPVVASVTAGLDALIASIPEEPEQAELAPGLGEEPKPRRAAPVVTIRVTDGWQERYTGYLDEPEGAEWLAAYALASPVIEAGGILTLHGKRGTGKTRMAAEIARAGRYRTDQMKGKPASRGDATHANPTKTAIYRTAMDIFVEIKSTFGRKEGPTMKDLMTAFAECALLVIDECHVRGETQWENDLLTNLLDKRYGAERPTILISNLLGDAFGESLGASIVSRAIECGKRIEFKHESYREKRRMFR